MSKNIAYRHQQILEKLQNQGFVTVNELSEELDVSLVTIRKDLKVLENRNLIFRSHGSASLAALYIAERNINEKEKIFVDEKKIIAKIAVNFVEPNETIILGSGSTIYEFAHQLKLVKPLTVITASLNIAQMLNAVPEIEVFQLGGSIRKSSNSSVGPFAERMIAEFSCSKLFIGADGITPEFGVSTTSSMEATLNQQMIKSALEVIVLADSSKFGRRGFGKICDLSAISKIITDKKLSDTMSKNIEIHGVEVIRV